jgi:hypothetical protein
MSGFGRPFPGDAADWIDLRVNQDQEKRTSCS